MYIGVRKRDLRKADNCNKGDVKRSKNGSQNNTHGL